MTISGTTARPAAVRRTLGDPGIERPAPQWPASRGSPASRPRGCRVRGGRRRHAAVHPGLRTRRSPWSSPGARRWRCFRTLLHSATIRPADRRRHPSCRSRAVVPRDGRRRRFLGESAAGLFTTVPGGAHRPDRRAPPGLRRGAGVARLRATQADVGDVAAPGLPRARRSVDAPPRCLVRPRASSTPVGVPMIVSIFVLDRRRPGGHIGTGGVFLDDRVIHAGSTAWRRSWRASIRTTRGSSATSWPP